MEKEQEVTSIQPAPGAETLKEISELTKKLSELGQTDLVGRAEGWEFRMKKIKADEEGPQKRKLEHSEIHPIVVNLSDKLFKILSDELKDICDAQRWLIHGRVINLIFAGFYRPTMQDAARSANEAQKDLQ